MTQYQMIEAVSATVDLFGSLDLTITEIALDTLSFKKLQLEAWKKEGLEYFPRMTGHEVLMVNGVRILVREVI